MAIWNFRSYRDYLLSKFDQEGSRSGLRKRLAEALPVHTTYVSQVLSGRADFSLEQGEVINSFFEHSEDEGEYFILLLLQDRAGTPKLRARFEKKIDALLEERTLIRKRLKAEGTISQEAREKFYSSTLYGAIHVLSALKDSNTVEALAEKLRQPRAKIQAMVDFMLGLGVIKEQRGHLAPGPRHVHLGGDSTLISKHHSNWRLHALGHLQFHDPNDLHYSACLTLSRKDVEKIRESILSNLKSNVDVISSSPEEVAYVMNIDFYKMVQ